MKRRTFLAGTAAIAATAIASPALSFDRTEEFVELILENVICDNAKGVAYENIQNTSGKISGAVPRIFTPSKLKMELKINEAVARNLSHLIETVSTNSFEFNYAGTKWLMMNRHLSARWTFESAFDGRPPTMPDGTSMEDFLINALIEKITAEHIQSNGIMADIAMKNNHAPKPFIPYTLMRSQGVMIDPQTFEPVVTFMKCGNTSI